MNVLLVGSSPSSEKIKNLDGTKWLSSFNKIYCINNAWALLPYEYVNIDAFIRANLRI